MFNYNSILKKKKIIKHWKRKIERTIRNVFHKLYYFHQDLLNTRTKFV